MQTVLFVCSGNTCRSPMAEAIARHWLSDGGRSERSGVFVASAGLSAFDGVPISPETLQSLARLGIDAEGTSKQLTAEMIRGAQVVLCMTATHVRAARDLVAGEPEQVEKIRLLDPDGDLEDPIGRGQDAYDELAGQLMRLVPRRLEECLVP